MIEKSSFKLGDSIAMQLFFIRLYILLRTVKIYQNLTLSGSALFIKVRVRSKQSDRVSWYVVVS